MTTKKEPKFKIGDFIKIINVDDEADKKNIGRSGRIINLHYYEDDSYNIEMEFDSETLKSFNEFELKRLIKEELSPFYTFIPEEDVEAIEAKDTIQELEKTQDIIDMKMLKLERIKVNKNDFRFFTDKWIRNFSHSKQFMDLSYQQKINAPFVIDVFGENMSMYEDSLPEEWSPEGLEKVCTDTMPQKTTMDKEDVDCIVPILTEFFKYLAENKILETKNLQTKLKAIEKQIVNNFNDENKWSHAKKFSMAMLRDDIDITDQEAVSEYMKKYNAQLKEKLEKQ